MGNMTDRLILFIISLLLFGGCNLRLDWTSVIVRSTSSDDEISIVTKGDIRYIYDGSSPKLPETNYIKLDISEIDKLGDAILICWKNKGDYWKVYNTYAKVIDNTLIGNKYIEVLDEYGGPTSEGYEGPNCGSFLIRENKVIPDGSLSLNYR